MTTKKMYVELVELLESNKNVKVSTLMDQIIEMTSSKKKEITTRKNEKGEITHIFCWYHKEWESVEGFGKKSSSHSGYNTMCKKGVNQWTKQQSTAKKEKSKLLDGIMSGEIPREDGHELMAKIEEERTKVLPVE